jgi:hypothetical protein
VRSFVFYAGQWDNGPHTLTSPVVRAGYADKDLWWAWADGADAGLSASTDAPPSPIRLTSWECPVCHHTYEHYEMAARCAASGPPPLPEGMFVPGRRYRSPTHGTTHTLQAVTLGRRWPSRHAWVGAFDGPLRDGDPDPNDARAIWEYLEQDSGGCWSMEPVTEEAPCP